MGEERNRNGKLKTNDPQIRVPVKVKQGSQCELLCFNIRLGLFELAVICNIPEEGQNESVAYIKHKVHFPSFRGRERDREEDNGDDTEEADDNDNG